MKKIFFLAVATLFATSLAYSQACTDNNGLPLGSVAAPCDNPGPVSTNFFAFEVWRGDQYTWTNLKANGNYVFDICQGTGGTAWTASFTIVDPGGNVIATGTDIGSICQISFTAPVDGDYDMYIIEAGVCPPAILTAAGVDNGVPRLTYNGGASCDPPVTTCESGTNDGVTDSEVCPDETTTASFSGITIPNSPTLGAIAVEFTPVDPANPTGVTVAITLGSSAPGGLASYEFGNDPEGILAANLLPAFEGDFNVKLVSTSDASVSVFDEANRCDSTDAVVVTFLAAGTGGCTGLACQVGSVANGDQTVCPGEDVTLALTGENITDDPALTVFWIFIDTAATADTVFFVPFAPTGPSTYNFTGDLNGALAAAELPTLPPAGYLGFAGVFDSTAPDGAGGLGAFCGFSDPATDFFLTILDGSDPSCEPACESPYPAVDNASLSVAQNPVNGAITFSWTPIPGQIGCQVNAVIGSLGNPVTQTSIIVGGQNASSFTAPGSALVPFNFNTINFRVRCGCSQTPLIAGPYSDFISIFNNLPLKSNISASSRTLTETNPYSIKFRKGSEQLLDLPRYVGVVDIDAPTPGPVSRDFAANVRTDRNVFDVYPNPSNGAINATYNSDAEGIIN
ncbi:MAG: hypothetical protein AAGC47_11815, partial [Bacteroidota bacterium]